MPDTQARIEALRWAASYCNRERHTCDYAARYAVKPEDYLTLAAIWRSRANTFRAMADELERSDAWDALSAWGDEMREKYGITREDAERAIRVVREAKKP